MRAVLAVCALAATVAAVSLAPAAGRADQGPKPRPPTSLWKAYPLVPRHEAASHAKALGPPNPASEAPSPETSGRPTATAKATARKIRPRRQASYQISTEQTSFPTRLLVFVFLLGLLTVAAAMVVPWQSVGAGVRGVTRRVFRPARAIEPEQPEPVAAVARTSSGSGAAKPRHASRRKRRRRRRRSRR